MSQILSAKDLAIARRLEPTSLTVERGQLVGLIGPNGSGKTSLLHALAGIPPATGDVVITGRQPGKLPPAARQRLFTFLPASRDVTWPLAARHFIELALPAGSDWSGLADRFELEPLLDRRMDRLSTGERTRVMIARALAPDPLVLLLDEPLANLDPYWQVVLLDELRDRATRAGRSAIVAIHDLRAALNWSDRVLLMNERRLWADGAPAHLRASGQLQAVFRVGPEQL
ncbi:MAG TPA: ABC transporter ATP-binding protein [Sphingomicrobium sp.]